MLHSRLKIWLSIVCNTPHLLRCRRKQSQSQRRSGCITCGGVVPSATTPRTLDGANMRCSCWSTPPCEATTSAPATLVCPRTSFSAHSAPTAGLRPLRALVSRPTTSGKLTKRKDAVHRMLATPRLESLTKDCARPSMTSSSASPGFLPSFACAQMTLAASCEFKSVAISSALPINVTNSTHTHTHTHTHRQHRLETHHPTRTLEAQQTKSPAHVPARASSAWSTS
jgi:hypothetical protein